MSEPTETDSSELLSVLDDLRRHLSWQAGSGGAVILSERPPSAAGGASFRDAFMARQTPGARPEAARPAPTSPPAARPQPAASAPLRPEPPARAEPVARAAPEPAARPAPTAPRAAPEPAARPAAPTAPRAAPEPDARPITPVASPVPERPAAAAVLSAARPLASPEGPARRTLEEIRSELGDCQRCKLCKTRKNIVFGTGNPHAELVFVGEGPGEQEDLQAEPFVGAAGQLLTKMIEAMGFSRDQVYICNVVKCRPPGNRNPEPDEIEPCEPFLKAQLASIQPKAIVALGKFAAQTLLRDSTAISRMRGHWREYQGIRLMPTFHPAYLLRNPNDKKLVWQDLQQVMKLFGRDPQKKS